MHFGHTRYTSTLINIKIQYANLCFLSVLHFIKIKQKNVYDNTVCPGKLV